MPMNPILPEEPEVSLLRGASPYSGGGDPFLTIGGFSDGFDTEVECGRSCGWPTCASDPIPDKIVAGLGDETRFRPIWLYYAESCGAPTDYSDVVAERALRMLLATQSAPLATQLWAGTVDPGQPTLRSTAALPPGGATAISPVAALARVVSARRRVSGSGHVVVHAPWVLAPHLVSAQVVRRSGGAFVGDGFKVIFDNGYPDDGGIVIPGVGLNHSGPAVVPNGPPTPGEVWIYATGRVEVELAPVNDGPQSQGAQGRPRFVHVNPRRNEWMVLVERLAFYRFDPCSVYAHSVSVPT